ncbi:flagellar rod assembly protein FlgJ [Marinomonas sp. S3726]|uniref:flagellar assembly peptidoglycan hydrolase FlgJ n=1 Tax=Marinomonas sp. S3726 TaxID=579484 RepID=UPI0005FA141F|nr:flagellar assembly peptidoglycan hydrolase FlgJ [Marinomonas sp. S3726]KJZ14660.1 flagellar rod assembly protein FlgJ [Marinomonas sp. S3726]
MNNVSSNEFYADFNALAKLKTSAKQDPEAALKKVAQEFESIFINMMLKNMRQANETIGSDLFSSNESKQYQEMLDSQMAQSLSKAGGMGIADALIRQFQGQGAATGAKPGSETAFLNQVATQDLARIQVLAKNASQDLISQAQSVAADEDIDLAKIVETLQLDLNTKQTGQTAEQVAFKSPEEFIQTLWPHAKAAAEKLGVNPKAILAQAALETGWGKYPIAKQDGSASYNLFGIKADARWQGERAVVTTLEYENGVAKKQVAPFRAYQSFAHSFDDYADFLTSSDRYKGALSAGDDVASFAANLQQGGYATDPKYSEKIQGIAKSEWLESL